MIVARSILADESAGLSGRTAASTAVGETIRRAA